MTRRSELYGSGAGKEEGKAEGTQRRARPGGQGSQHRCCRRRSRHWSGFVDPVKTMLPQRQRHLRLVFKPRHALKCKRLVPVFSGCACSIEVSAQSSRSIFNCRKGPPGPRRGGRCGGATPSGSSRQRHGRRGPPLGERPAEQSRDGGVAGFAAVPGGPLGTEGHPARAVRSIWSRGAPLASRAKAHASPTKPKSAVNHVRTVVLTPTNADPADLMCDFPHWSGACPEHRKSSSSDD